MVYTEGLLRALSIYFHDFQCLTHCRGNDKLMSTALVILVFTFIIGVFIEFILSYFYN